PVTESIDAPVSVPVLSLSSGSAAVTNLHGQAESCKAAGTDVESNIQHLLYLGKGKWDRETVTHALHAASNDRRKAVQYILFGDLEEDDIPPEAWTPTPGFAFAHQPVAASGGPNAAPLDLFLQRTSKVDSEARACILESWRNSECFQAFRTTVQADPHRLVNQLLNLLMLLFLFRGSAAVTNLHGQAESCKAAGTDVESNIQHLLYLGKGKWDRETVTHALHAASNDRRKAVQYILFGDLEEDDIPPEAWTPTPGFAFAHQPVAASGGPNAAPLDLFLQRTSKVDSEARACILESWRNSECFQAFRTTVQADPHRLVSLKSGKHRNTLSQMEFMRRKIKRGKEEFAPCARRIIKECKAMLRNKGHVAKIYPTKLNDEELYAHAGSVTFRHGDEATRARIRKNKEAVKCFKCQGSGHFANACPQDDTETMQKQEKETTSTIPSLPEPKRGKDINLDRMRERHNNYLEDYFDALDRSANIERKIEQPYEKENDDVEIDQRPTKGASTSGPIKEDNTQSISSGDFTIIT
nr:hypothetical protein [Tanacetum cinerariifolium]